MIEKIGAFLAHGLESLSHRRKCEAVALLHQFSSRSGTFEDAAGLGGRLINRTDHSKKIGVEGADNDPLAAKPDGRVQNSFNRQAVPVAVDREETRHVSGDRDRSQADMEFLGGGAEVDVDGKKVKLGRRGEAARSLNEEIIEAFPSTCGMGQEKPPAPERSQDRLP